MKNFLIKDIRVWAFAIPLMAACAVSAVSAKAQTALSQPVVVDSPMVHDPVMAYENGKYYLYCTGHGAGSDDFYRPPALDLESAGCIEGRGSWRFPVWTHDSVPGYESHTWAYLMSSGIRISGIWLIPVLPSARILLPSDC